ncbi:hypothetical protein ABIE27_002369 [Paenibacillus sp. 4624]|nr:hypothetical protein [Paenibacillus amylolyticus]
MNASKSVELIGGSPKIGTMVRSLFDRLSSGPNDAASASYASQGGT